MTHGHHTWQLESVGVDWITCTARDEKRQAALWCLAQELGRQQLGEGRKEGVFSYMGYRGWRYGPISFGGGDHGVLVRCSGEVAAGNWRRLLRCADNVSRADLAVTARCNPGWPTLAGEAYQAAQGWRGRGGKPLKASLVTSSDGGSTAYIGSRVSERFGRVYDKGREADTDPRGMLWRWELELKDGSALNTLHSLASSPTPELQMQSVVIGWFRERGVPTPPLLAEGAVVPAPRTPTDDAQKMEWMRSQVSPSVRALLQSQPTEAVFKALGIPLELLATRTARPSTATN